MKPDIIRIDNFIKTFSQWFNEQADENPWEFVAHLEHLLTSKIDSLGSDYVVTNGIAVHKSAKIEEHAILKPPVIISENCFIAAHCYLRGGVFVGPKSVVGPGSEVKSSVMLNNSALAHFNFIGDSIVGANVNMEAGSVIANHLNERTDKTITVVVDGKKIRIPSTKFGALVGDNTRIGANAVLSPGTILKPNSIVKRLELVEQA
jgi:UDP-N-acetylglucosamine diphosphorylase / glucose-1-phosphate thymidylyltransferase / UDP-N-acetylgalactosamine diphosphorylase / glucosamine-1-phosphate N-acetyltransferase / galactosamine-1-phosphate N-acetyltransferase